MTITVNKKTYTTDKDTTLLDFLRNTLSLTGTKDGCSEGACGACSVIIDGKLAKACTRKLSRIDGSSVITIEGLSEREKAVYSYAFAKAGAVQCGFCTPGMIIAAKALIDKVPDPSADEIRKAIRGNICRCTGYVKIEEAIRLAARMIRNGEDIPEYDTDPRISGTMVRIDAIDKALGRGIFADDIRIDGMLYAAAVRSPAPRCRIVRIDDKDAKADPRCIAVIKAEDVPYNRHGHITPDWPVLIPEGDITSYTGDAICLVVSSERDALEELKEKVRIDYEVLEGVFSPEEALKDEILVHQGQSNVYDTERIVRGDADKAIADSDIVIADTFRTPFTEHAFMEPECAIGYPYADGVLVYAGDQSVYDDQREIARMLCLPAEKVRVKSTLVGGGFGGKEDMSVQHHAALAAYILKRPVNMKLTRQESLMVHPKRHPMVITMTLGATREGRINGLKAEILSEALPYIQRFHGKTIVIKYGGNAMTDRRLQEAFARDVVLLKLVGLNPVVVHGGGPQINSALNRVGIKSQFVQGMRVTDPATMEVVEWVLCGEVQGDLVQMINSYGGHAVGLNGKDGAMIKARRMKLQDTNDPNVWHDVGQVGLIESINPSVVQALEQDHFIPVISPIGMGEDGLAYNINADVVAGKMAETLKAEKLVMLTNTPGVLDRDGNLLTGLSASGIDALFKDGTISGGMLPKLSSALSAARNGVRSVHIIDGRVIHCLLLEILTPQGVGTMINAD